MNGFVLGIGCRTACSLPALHALYTRLCQQLDDPCASLQAIGCWAPRQHHEGLMMLARQLEVPLEAWPTTALIRQAPYLSHHSAALFRRTGLWGVAESAALASAQSRTKQSAKLWVTRLVATSHDATGAIACC